VGKVFKALNKGASTDEADLPWDADSSHEPLAGDSSLPEAEPAGLTDHQAPPTPPLPPSQAIPPPFRENLDTGAMVDNWNERLVAALGTASAPAEELRRLRTSILHPPAGKKPARTILVTSAMPEEGKTFICAGLAVTLAQGVKEHALLVDCDLRRPLLGEMFGLANDQGLVDHLARGVDLGRLIRKVGHPKLSVIPSGPPPVNPAELLGSERLLTMINEVAERYADRYIIFDSPPLLKAAETAILAKHLDGVVLVVREGGARREDIQQLVETIGPEKIIGVVFNAYQTNVLERKIYGSPSDYYSSHRQNNG